MNVHILMPFHRRHLYNTLIHYYEPHNIIWHPIGDDWDLEPFRDNSSNWIQPYRCPELKPGEQAYRKLNDFIEGNELVPEDYYGFACDDDMFEPGFFDELKTRKEDIVFNSSYRGDKIPNDGTEPHPTGCLIHHDTRNIAVCCIGLGMFFVKGEVLQNLRFGITYGWDDGRFAEMLVTLGKSMEFMPDWFLLFNYFQPGRFTDPNCFVKNTWELPKII